MTKEDQLTIRVPSWLRTELERRARDEDRSVSAMARRIISRALEDRDDRPVAA